jgi:hypothetical protein
MCDAEGRRHGEIDGDDFAQAHLAIVRGNACASRKSGAHTLSAPGACAVSAFGKRMFSARNVEAEA